MGIREQQHNVLKQRKSRNQLIVFKVQKDLFSSRVNIVKQISVSLPLPLWHFQRFSQQFVLLFPSPFPSTHYYLSFFLFLSFAHTVLAYCSSTGARLSACHKSVFWRRRQETPSLMEGNSNLLSGRGEDISICIYTACVQRNYHSWHPEKLKFNLHNLQSLQTVPLQNHHLSKCRWEEQKEAGRAGKFR